MQGKLIFSAKLVRGGGAENFHDSPTSSPIPAAALYLYMYCCSTVPDPESTMNLIKMSCIHNLTRIHATCIHAHVPIDIYNNSDQNYYHTRIYTFEFDMHVAKPSVKFTVVCVLALVALFTVSYLTSHHLLVVSFAKSSGTVVSHRNTLYR